MKKLCSPRHFSHLFKFTAAAALLLLCASPGLPVAEAAGNIQVQIHNDSSRALHLYHADPGEQQLHRETTLRAGSSQAYVNVTLENHSGEPVEIDVVQVHGQGGQHWQKPVLINTVNHLFAVTHSAVPGSEFQFRHRGEQTAFGSFTTPNRSATHKIQRYRRGHVNIDDDDNDDDDHDHDHDENRGGGGGGSGALDFARDIVGGILNFKDD